MRRVLIDLWLISALAACAGATPDYPPVLEATATLAVPEANAIEVRVYRIPPGVVVEKVLLMGAADERLEASDLRRSTRESDAGLVSRPSLGIAVSGGSDSGINPAVSLGWSVTRGDSPKERSREISARIDIPDPALYRATASGWAIEVHYTDIAGRARVLTFPAPTIE